VIFLIAGVAAAFVSLRVRRYVTSAIQEVEERNRVAGLFGQHVSPEVVEKLLNDPPDGMTEVRDVTVMFLDIRDFTAYSEGKSPEEVMTYLNRLFGMMVESVNQHNGIVNKFLGDGFMAVFGAPFSSGEDTRNAVDAALEIYRRVDEAAAKGEIAPTRIGIGLHAGTAVTGNVGTSARQEYTIIGDVVNVASRVEGLNKQFNSQVLVTHVVWDRLGSPRPDGKSLGPVDVRGHQAVEVFQLV
jgi:adenylate cyclase